MVSIIKACVILFFSVFSNAQNSAHLQLQIDVADDDEDEEEYINFIVVDEFHEKFGPAVS